MTANFDEEMRQAREKNGVAWYLMASLAYYHWDRPILSDGAFDELARWLLERWETVQHPHKNLITEDDLRAGTLLLEEKRFPWVCSGAATRLVVKIYGKGVLAR